MTAPIPANGEPKPRARARRRPRWMMWLLVLGPGLIAANAGNDAGGIATYASAGAQFGYRTLFVMALVTIALVIVQEMSARLGADTEWAAFLLVVPTAAERSLAVVPSVVAPDFRCTLVDNRTGRLLHHQSNFYCMAR